MAMVIMLFGSFDIKSKIEVLPDLTETGTKTRLE